VIDLLPTINALLNTTSAILLFTGHRLILRGRRDAHKKFMIAAFAVSSAFLVFGMALVYSQAGSMAFSRIAAEYAARDPGPIALVGLVMILVGIGFKLAVVPFHLWTPDVYDGAPAPVTGFIATVSKGAMVVVLARAFAPALVVLLGKHLFWPNPLQLVTKISDILSLSLRLFGNIGGEFLVVLLVVKAAPYGIPLVIHTLGLIPAFIQPLVFTLLTSNFLAEAVHTDKKKAEVDTQTSPPFSAVAERKRSK
jgi:uncharacterized membrane protein YozB (DUF420 family)